MCISLLNVFLAFSNRSLMVEPQRRPGTACQPNGVIIFRDRVTMVGDWIALTRCHIRVIVDLYKLLTAGPRCRGLG